MKKHSSLSLKIKKTSLGLSCLAFVISLSAVTSSFVDDGESAPGKCWKSERVICNATTTTTTYSGSSMPWAGPSDYDGKTTTDAAGNITTITLSATPVWDPVMMAYRSKIQSKSVTVVSSSRSDCATEGTSDCQPTGCDGQAVGAAKICPK